MSARTEGQVIMLKIKMTKGEHIYKVYIKN